jgi:hypothetical protein
MFGLFGPSKKDILEEGRQAMATVRDVSDTGTRVNGKPRIQLTLEVAPMGQPTFTVEKKALLDPDEIPGVGRQIPVRFLPEDHDRLEIDRDAMEMSQAQIVTPKGNVPAAPPPPPPPPQPKPIPDPTTQPEEPATDFQSLVNQAMAQGSVTVSGNAQIIDARNVEGLREQMAKTLQAYGISMPNVPMPGLPPEQASAGAEDDPVAKLEKLSELHKQGVLTDAEFQSAKSKLLGEL